MTTIRQVAGERDLGHLRQLLRAYAETLAVPFCRDELEAELATIGTAGAGAASRYFLAMDGGSALGCIGLRELDAETAELVRLYVVPEARSTGLGRRLVAHTLADAAAEGRTKVVLHTLAAWRAACVLYRRMGFRPIPPYRDIPEDEDDVMFLGMPLEEGEKGPVWRMSSST